MKILLATFVGSNRDFRAWLKAGMPANVALEGHKMKNRQGGGNEKVL